MHLLDFGDPNNVLKAFVITGLLGCGGDIEETG
jgi:hypothetical protein